MVTTVGKITDNDVKVADVLDYDLQPVMVPGGFWAKVNKHVPVSVTSDHALIVKEGSHRIIITHEDFANGVFTITGRFR